MKNKSKKMMLFSLVVMLGFSFVSLIVAFSIKNIPENISYVYVNKKVEERSWHDSYERVNDIIGLFAFVNKKLSHLANKKVSQL